MARPKEGIYASSVSPDPSVALDQGRVIHQDLGLTLSPGLQISTGQDEGRLATPRSSTIKNVGGNETAEQVSRVRKHGNGTTSKDKVEPKHVLGNGQEQDASQQGLLEKARNQESRVLDRSPTSLTKTNGEDIRRTGTSNVPAAVQRSSLPRTYPREDDACHLVEEEHQINPLANTNSSTNQKNEDVYPLSPKDKQPGVPAHEKKSLKRRREIEDVDGDGDGNIVSLTDNQRAVPNPTASSGDRGSNRFSPQPPSHQPLCSTQIQSVCSSKTSTSHTLDPQASFHHPVLPDSTFDRPVQSRASFDHPVFPEAGLGLPVHSQTHCDYPVPPGASVNHPLHPEPTLRQRLHREAGFKYSLHPDVSSWHPRLVRSVSCPPLSSRDSSTDMSSTGMIRKPGNYKKRKHESIPPWATKNVPPYLSSPASSQSPNKSPSAPSQSPYQSPAALSQSPSRRGRNEALSESPSKRPRIGSQSSATHPALPSSTSDVNSQQNDGFSSFQITQQANNFPSEAFLVNPSTHTTPFFQSASISDEFNQRPCSQPTFLSSQQFYPFSTGMSLIDSPFSATPIDQGASTSNCYYQQPISQPMLRTSRQASAYPHRPSFVNPSINDTRYAQGVSNPHSDNELLTNQIAPRKSQPANAFSSAPSPRSPLTHGTPPHQAFSPVVGNQGVAPHENLMSPPTTSNTTPQRSLSISHDAVYSSNPSGAESTTPARRPETPLNKKSQARLDKALSKNQKLKAEVKSMKEELATKSQQVKQVLQGTYIQGLKQTINRQNEKLAKKDEEIAHWKQSSQRFENMVKQWQPPITSTAGVLANYGFDATNRAIDSMGYRPSVPSEPISLGHRAPLFYTRQGQSETIIIADDDEDMSEGTAPRVIGPSTVGTTPVDDAMSDGPENSNAPTDVLQFDFSEYDDGPMPDSDLFNQDNTAPTGPTLSERVLHDTDPVDASPLPTTPAMTTPQEAAHPTNLPIAPPIAPPPDPPTAPAIAPPTAAPEGALSQEAVPVDEATAERERRAKQDIWLAAINANQNLPAEWRYDITRRIEMERDIHDMMEEDAAMEDAEGSDEAGGGTEEGAEKARTDEEEEEYVAGLGEEDALDYMMGNGAFSGFGEDFPVPNLDEFDFGG